MSSPLVCHLGEAIKHQVSESKHDLQQLKDQVKSKPKELLNAIKKQVVAPATKILSEVEQKYQQTSLPSIRSARPDLTLLVEVCVLLGLGLLLYLIWPYLSGKSPIYSKAQYLKALNTPESAYSVADLGKVRMELQALRDYFSYYASNPFSPESQGRDIILQGNTFLPILSFLIVYVLPPIVILYIIWFIWTYYTYVLNATWGWIVMMKSYGTTKFEHEMGQKWYLVPLFGDPADPVFSDYFNEWRTTYVDIPVFIEKLKYVKEYYEAKEKYYTLPKRYYVDLPMDQYKIKAEYYRKVYVDRALEVFMRKMVDWSQTYYEAPRDQLYRHLLSDNAQMAGIWAKMIQSQRQIRGLPYEKVTASGQKCSCPGNKKISKVINQIVKNAEDDWQEITQVYDQVHPVPITHIKPCALATEISGINWGQSLTYVLVLLVAGLLTWCWVFGLPGWLSRLLTPIWRFKTINLKPQFLGRYQDYSLVMMVVAIIAVILVIGYGLYYFNRDREKIE